MVKLLYLKMLRQSVTAAILVMGMACCSGVNRDGSPYPHPGWNLMFKASRGNNQSVFALWSSHQFTSNPTPEQTALNAHCGCHFKSVFVERWASLNIKEVAVILYEDYSLSPARAIYFDGEHTNKMNWFDQRRLRSSSWRDLTMASTTDAFSVRGPTSANNPYRRFVINAKEYSCEYNGNLDSGNVGWFFIEDSGKGGCKYESKTRYWPTFIYSTADTKVNYAEGISIGYADIFTIFIYI